MQATRTVNGVRVKKAKSKKATRKKTHEKKVTGKFEKGISKGFEAVASGAKKIGELVCDFPKNSISFVSEKTPEVGVKAKDLIFKNVPKVSPVDIMKDMGTALGIGEKASIKSKIRELNKKIKSLQLDIGRERSRHALDIKVENEKIKELVAKIKIYEGEVERLKHCIEKIESKQKEVEGRKVKAPSPEKQFKQTKKNLESMTKKSLRKKDVFESEGQKCIFSNAAKGLIDEDVERRIMAVSELGKIGHRESVPLLNEAFSYGNAYLDSEIISALINIHDPSVLEILQKKMKDPNYRVRLECLRGMYKLGGKEVIDDLLSSVNDDHADVRRTALTCLGWCAAKEAVPALVESLKDKNKEVKKAAALALGDIKDIKAVKPMITALADSNKDIRKKVKFALAKVTEHEIPFNTSFSGEENLKEVKKLRRWWNRGAIRR